MPYIYLILLTRGVQDPGNANGGKWIIRVNKGFVSRLWEDLVLAIVGDQARVPSSPMSLIRAQFDVGDEICGAVVSIRYNEDIIAVWNKSALDADITAKIRCAFCMQIPPCRARACRADGRAGTR